MFRHRRKSYILKATIQQVAFRSENQGSIVSSTNSVLVIFGDIPWPLWILGSPSGGQGTRFLSVLPTPVHLSILTRPPWLEMSWWGPKRSGQRWTCKGHDQMVWAWAGHRRWHWENPDWGGHPDSTDLMWRGQRPTVWVWGKGVGREIKQD